MQNVAIGWLVIVAVLLVYAAIRWGDRYFWYGFGAVLAWVVVSLVTGWALSVVFSGAY